MSLNYQMEMLEKGMVGLSEARAVETQKTYVRMRREIEKKEVAVRELKELLNPSFH